MIFAADWLVQSCVKFSFTLRLSPLFIGLVLVAFGTSLPEAGVGITAAIINQKAIALGNVLGSNIANIGLVLGLCAAFWPVKVIHKSILKREMPLFLISVILLYLLSLDLLISRLDGLILVMLFAVFCFVSYRWTGKAFDEKEGEDFELRKGLQAVNSRFIIWLIIIFSLLGVFLGADLMVRGGVGLARIFGISPWIIGITVFAVGTSLPELAASLIASIKRVHSISVGNIVGSNIFNILFVLGVVALIRPITLQASVLRFELPMVLLFSLALLVVMKTDYRITRTEGVVLFLGYVIFIVLLIMRS